MTTDTAETNNQEQLPQFVPYQLCPKCNGQGLVSKPPWVAGDVFHWSSTESVFPCDVCYGAKIIPQHLLTEPQSSS